jgi:Protein of unknown function (DUF3304)
MSTRRLLYALLAGVALTACNPAPRGQTVAGAAAPATPAASSPWDVQEYEKDGATPRRYSVVPYGYNYTDLYIDSFEVDGAGGGNLAVSTPTSPGGGSTCCTTLVSGLPEGTEFVIKWTRDRQRWCSQTVKLTKPIPKETRYLEVHFYPDGKIEIEASKQSSPPRLKLERFSRGERKETGNVNNDEKFSRCKDGYR